MDEARRPIGALRLPAVAAGVGVVVLLALVAVASRGDRVGAGTPAPANRAAGERIFDYLFTGILAYIVVGIFFLAYLFAVDRGGLRDTVVVRRRHPVYAPVIFLTVIAVVILLIGSWRRVTGDDERRRPEATPTATVDAADEQARRQRYEPEFRWPAFAFVAMLGVALAGAIVAAKRRRGPAHERLPELADALAATLERTLDDLRSERDARRAVIAAYARMEATLAAHGIPRRPAEAPLEYLARVLTDLELDERSIRRLTDLFERAKFSEHAVSPEMKDSAIDALESIRDELKDAA